MAVSKRLRYEVLRRDNHTCTYCGGSAPDVKLTVDHVIPTALGGTDEPRNLTTACVDCNAGKTSSSPDAPLVATVEADALRWGRAMRKAREAVDSHRKVRDYERALFKDVWLMFYGDESEMPVTWRTTVDDLMGAGLGADDLQEAVEISAQYYRRDPWRYFCGVAWNKVSALQDVARSLLAKEGN